jgi:ferredoxin-NADP reductase
MPSGPAGVTLDVTIRGISGVAMSPTTHVETDLDLVVQYKHEAADGVVVVGLGTADGILLPNWEPGAHVDLHLGGDGGLIRQYSLCGDPADRSCWSIAILREQDGRGGSRYAHDELPAGARVKARGPRNHFPFRQSERYLFIGGGIGITPLIPMIAAADAVGADWRLVYGGRSRQSMAFVDDLVAEYAERVTVWPQDTHGLLNLGELLGTPQADTHIYCCGPEPLLNAVEPMCTSWPPGSLHLERFAPKEVGERVITGPFEVEIVSTGQVLTVEPEVSVLDVLQNSGLFVDSSCEEGTCGSCEVAVVEGAIDHRDSVLTQEERDEGKLMMVCVSRAACPRLILDL